MIAQRCSGGGGNQLAIACQSSVFRRHLNEVANVARPSRETEADGGRRRRQPRSLDVRLISSTVPFTSGVVTLQRGLGGERHGPGCGAAFLSVLR